MSTRMQEASAGRIFHGTNRHKGRRIAITPENSAMKHLAYGRIILDAQVPLVEFSTGNREVGLICLYGECSVKVEGATHELGRYDSIYLPRDAQVEIKTVSGVDLAECSAAVDNRYPLQVVRYADVEQNGALKFKTGGSSNTRTVNITLGKNIEADVF